MTQKELQHEVKLIEKDKDGLYLVVESGDKRLFYAWKGIGGHSDMAALLNRTIGEDEKSIAETVARYAAREARPLLEKALKECSSQEYHKAIGGGKYCYSEGQLKLFGKSYSFGPVAPAILKEFEKPIHDYCAKEGLELKLLKMLIE